MIFFDDRERPAVEGRTWEFVTREGIEENARSVVGPDDPYREYTPAEMADRHWAILGATVEREGVTVESGYLWSLPHDVEFSDRLLAALEASRGEIA